ncbi:MAG: isoprenylcysteine carboxylmethyltransferase family protein [Chloroflexota bacterium]
MYLFLILLLLSFICNISSAFTAAYSLRLGQRRGQLLSAVLRNVFGIPLLGVSFVLAARRPAPRLFAEVVWVDTVGGLLIIAGAVLILLALVVLRGRSAAPSMTDTLARHGLYAIVRHPLYDGVFCELAGAVLLRPTWPILLSCLLTAGWLVVQARAEEHDLVQRIPGYREYMAQVPRFIPRLRR